ncbi:hypothetical protein [Halobacillus mangrovi]|uniref:hypothetical protein n=1 Tax=Halobacillus mangrovi TaxID=402384 RepID=UPI003D96CF7B
MWLVNLNTGTIQPYEEIIIRLTGCNQHMIYCVSHQWVQRFNQSFGTEYSPNNRALLASHLESTHKFTLRIWGKEDRIPKYYNIGPGESISI